MTERLSISTVSYSDCTIGRLFYEGLKIFTLELPWKNNASGVSCVPAKIYKAEKRLSPSLGWVIHILDVEGRTWIYIHKGNFTYQIKGCCLVGDGIKYIDGDSIPDVTNSAKVFDELFALLPDEFEVEFKRAIL